MVIDVRDEISRFQWRRPRWQPDKLIACSPFRNDDHPSFMIRLEPYGRYPAGTWTDSGATDPSFASGGLAKLIAYLDNVTYEEAREYLAFRYNLTPAESEEYVLSPQTFAVEQFRQPFDQRLTDAYRYRHPYLDGRKITEAVQRLMNVGYDKRSRAVTIPWYDASGRLANVKYRRVDDKTFWYASGGCPIREIVYGINVVYRRRLRRAAIVEAEIDAMTIMSAGIPAIAVGGARLSAKQAEIIRRSPLEEVTIVADHDDAGQRLKRAVIESLAQYITVKVAGYPKRYKDINEMALMLNLVNVSNVVNRAIAVKPLRALRLAF